MRDSGIISQDIIYNIAPAAKDRERPIRFCEIFPIRAPKNAPMPVLIPDIAVKIIAFDLLKPPVFNGSDIDIPSGISCKAMAIAKERPKCS